MTKRTCDVPRCERPHKGHGLCDTHLYRQKKGIPLTAEPLRQARAGLTCVAEDCDRPVVGKGLCSLHWQRQRSGIPLDAPVQVRNLGQPCKIEDCEAPSRNRGWCTKHYARWRQHGDPHVVLSRKVNRPCAVEGCERPYGAVGMCHFHRRRVLTGTPIEKPLKTAKGGECAADGCTTHAQYRGLCRLHRQRQDYRDNPIPFKAKTARRRYQASRGMDAADREHSTAYREAIDADPCRYCGGRTEVMHVDHQYPLSKGGTDHWWNLAQACSNCNLTKHARCGTWFLLWRGGGCESVVASDVA
ncbi:HNH endonuclease [Streptomyces sp. DT117]|uniref:HNH endonuclease n=1 Tax=Streptomyces sp. DT117 TaxID=3393422 RepID=UPI003CEFAFE6